MRCAGGSEGRRPELLAPAAADYGGPHGCRLVGACSKPDVTTVRWSSKPAASFCDSTGTGTQAIIDGVKRARVSRLLVVGGAGSLKLPSGGRVIDQPDFPAEWKDGALRTAAFLDRLRAETELDWAFLSPALMLVPGVRTGRYRTGRDDLLTDDAGESRISLQDYAVAMLDEAERPQRHRERFSVAY